MYVKEIASERRIQVSFDGGTAPRWSPDGRTLYYVRWRWEDFPSAHLVAVAIERSPILRAGEEKVIADWSRSGVSVAYRYDVYPDGEHFIRVRSQPTREVVLMQNWRSLVDGIGAGRENRR